jgi:hypothetical protein
MKNLFFNSKTVWFSSLMITMAFFTACDDVLEENPFTQISTEQFYQNETDVLSGLTGAYAQLKDGVGYYRQQLLSNLHAASDQGTSSWKHGEFKSGNIKSSNQNLKNPWNEMYRGIRDANNIIANAPNVDMEESLKMRVIGEAKFLRALHYFNLVRCFGEVPLRTEPLRSVQPGLEVSPITDIYQVIIGDLTDASQDCWGLGETKNGFTNDIGRVTNAAAHALLSKVYLRIASAKRTAQAGNEGNAKYLDFAETAAFYYEKAIDHADAAINQGDYALVGDLDSWVEIFSPTNGNNTEMLFDIQGSSLAEQGTAVSNLFSPKGAGLSGGGWGGTNKLIPNFINNHIDKNDPRFQNSIVRAYQDATKTYVILDSTNINPKENKEIKPYTGYIRTITKNGNANGRLNIVFTAKYVDSNATTEYTSEQNWHVIRLADVYLMRAEAMAELNQNPVYAADDINELRQRVGAADLDMTGMSIEEFRTALLRERGVELYMEGHRFFDLTRMGVYNEYCKNVGFGEREADDYFWPIPETETDANENID